MRPGSFRGIGRRHRASGRGIPGATGPGRRSSGLASPPRAPPARAPGRRCSSAATISFRLSQAFQLFAAPLLRRQVLGFIIGRIYGFCGISILIFRVCRRFALPAALLLIIRCAHYIKLYSLFCYTIIHCAFSGIRRALARRARPVRLHHRHIHLGLAAPGGFWHLLRSGTGRQRASGHRAPAFRASGWAGVRHSGPLTGHSASTPGIWPGPARPLWLHPAGFAAWASPVRVYSIPGLFHFRLLHQSITIALRRASHTIQVHVIYAPQQFIVSSRPPSSLYRSSLVWGGIRRASGRGRGRGPGPGRRRTGRAGAGRGRPDGHPGIINDSRCIVMPMLFSCSCHILLQRAHLFSIISKRISTALFSRLDHYKFQPPIATALDYHSARCYIAISPHSGHRGRARASGTGQPASGHSAAARSAPPQQRLLLPPGHSGAWAGPGITTSARYAQVLFRSIAIVYY